MRNSRHRTMLLAAAALLVASLVVLAALRSARTTKPCPVDEIRRVVVIHLDTTRTDDLRCYGGIAATPSIDAVHGN